MAWIELLDESIIGVAGGIAEIDPAGKLKIPTAGLSRDLTINDLSLSKADIDLGNVDNKSADDIIADMKSSLVADDIPDLGQAQIDGLTAALAGKVPTTRTINGKALSANISLAKGDVDLGNVDNKSSATIIADMKSSLVADDIPDLGQAQIDGLTAALAGKVPTTRTINGKALSANISLVKGDVDLGNVDNKSSATIIADMKSSLVAADIPDLDQDQIDGLTTALAGKVPTTRTINGKALSTNISLAKGDVGLGNVDNKSSATIRGEITLANITSTGIKTSHLIDSITGELPTTGYSEGDIVRQGGKLYVWRAA